MRIDGNILGNLAGQAINLTDLKGMLEKINIGDVVKAQILEITTSDVLLKMFDGSTVKASTAANIEGKPGDVLNLVVKEKKDNQIVFETVKNSVPIPAIKEDEIKKQLAVMGLKANDNNIEIVKELKTNNLPINSETLHKITELVTKFKDLTPSKAAFLLSGNIEPEEKNIAALNQIVDGKAKLVQKLDDIVKTVNSITDTKVLKNIENQLLELEPSNKSTIKPETKAPEIIKINIPEVEPPQRNETAVKELVTKIVKENISNLQSPTLKSTNIAQPLIDKIMDAIKENEIFTASNEKILGDFNKATNIFSKITVNEQSILKSTFENIVKKVKNILYENKAEILDPKAEEKPLEAVKIKENIAKVFDKFVIDVKSENLKEDINVKNLYKDIYSKLEVIKENIENSNLPIKNELTNDINNLQNNMRFMNELSNHQTYIQIPLQIWDKNTTGELYILKKDNKKKKIDPENVTVFISLDTENLGKIDSLIGVNKKNISVNLRVSQQEIIDYLKNNYKQLYEKLQDKGYKLVDVKYRLIEEEANLLNIKELVNKETYKGTGSIDYKL